MGHYEEILIAHAKTDPSYLKRIEIEVLNDAIQRDKLLVEGLPPDISDGPWRAYGLSEGNILLETRQECPACSGGGRLTAYGNNGVDYDVECPKCDGHGTDDGSAPYHRVVIDYTGNFIRELH